MNAITIKVLRIFTMFLMRDYGFTFEQAQAEKIVLEREIGKAGGVFSLVYSKGYTKLSRIGATVRKDRAERKKLQLGLENAFNHAKFELSK